MRPQHEDMAGADHGAGASLTITIAAREARRVAGPIAWSVLEDVVADARLEGGRLIAATNVRSIASHLQVSKDTAARALRHLAGLDLLVRKEAARTTAGTFGMSTYELRLDDLVGVVVAFAAGPAPSRRRLSGMERTVAAQPALFDIEGGGFPHESSTDSREAPRR